MPNLGVPGKRVPAFEFGPVRIGWIFAWLLIVATIIYPVAELVLRTHVLPQESESAVDWLIFLSSALVIAGAAFRTKTLEERTDRLRAAIAREQRLGDLSENFFALVVAVHRQSGIPITNLGVSAWMVPPSDTLPLTRLDTLHAHQRGHSGVEWTKGKGAVGLCWADRGNVTLDLMPLRGMTKKAFERLSDEARARMSWADYQATKAYSAVYATPVRDHEDRFIGVASIDCDLDDAAPILGKAVEDPTILGTIEIIRKTIVGITLPSEEEIG